MIRYERAYWDDVDIALQSVPNIRKIYGNSILITGATGMICSSVVDLLIYMNRYYNAGIRILLAGRDRLRMKRRFSALLEEADYVFVPYDATQNLELNVDADYIVHGAGNANPIAYVKQPVETVLANILGLNDLLSMAVRNHIRRVLYISSSEVYGNKTEDRPYQEEDYGYIDILNQRSSYPNAKRAAETLCIAYGQEHGLDTVIVRPGHIYGPTITDSDFRASAQFTRNAVRGENIVMKSAGLQLRSYCYTLDCASAILTVLMEGKSGCAYNISNRDSVVTISDMAHALAKAAGTKVVYERPSELEASGYNMMSNSSLNSEKLEALGWRAAFGLESGAEKTLAFYSL
ncbi:MAG: NAD(P)-dependent oxidoreductase [Firmicutes bacterium]|nr:NAD(P)-dependent oxidoreductase [Bacillota bacterium]